MLAHACMDAAAYIYICVRPRLCMHAWIDILSPWQQCYESASPWYLCSQCDLEHGRQHFAAQDVKNFLKLASRKKTLVCEECKRSGKH